MHKPNAIRVRWMYTYNVPALHRDEHVREGKSRAAAGSRLLFCTHTVGSCDAHPILPIHIYHAKALGLSADAIHVEPNKVGACDSDGQ